MYTSKRSIVIDDQNYKVDIYQRVKCPPHVVRILIPAYMPNKTAAELTRVCCESIAHLTREEFELWVVDNRSPAKFRRWLYEYPFINIIRNTTEPINPFLQRKIKRNIFGGKRITQQNDGSYANAIGLELGIRCIAQDSRYVFVMHSDTAVVRSNWLSFLMSKIDEHVKLAAFRKDTARIHALHIGGMLIDYDTYKTCKMSFLPNMRRERHPDLPEYDVGDQLTIKVQEAGYGTFVSRNSFNSPELGNDLAEDDPLRQVNVDKCFDDEGNIFFMHLGRGIPRSISSFDKSGKMSAQEWISFIEEHILLKSTKEGFEKQNEDLNYSLRRYFVDTFYTDTISKLSPQSEILDLGGKRIAKRGRFNAENYSHKVQYVNIDERTGPDHCADITCVPLTSGQYDAVICAETLEHVYDVDRVIGEAFRLLKPGGIFLVTVPFSMPIHPDPHDYARYTESYMLESLRGVGFGEIKIKKQGYLLSVIADMVAGYARNIRTDGVASKLVKKALIIGTLRLRRVALTFEKKPKLRFNPYVTSYTTGYGIIAEKPLSDPFMGK